MKLILKQHKAVATTGFIFHGKNINGRTGKIPILTHFVLNKPLIGFFDPLGKITKEGERRNLCIRQLCDVLHLNILSFVSGWWRFFNDGQHDLIEFAGGYLSFSVYIDFFCNIHHFQDTLFGQRRSKDNRKIGKGSQTLADGIFKCFDHNIVFSSTVSHLFTKTTNPLRFF